MSPISRRSSGEHAGRVAVIFDGAEGIGTLIAHRLDRLGARVTIVGADVSADKESRPDDEGTTVDFLSGNPAREVDAVRVFEEVVRRQGSLDYLVCCTPEAAVRPFLELTTQQWRDAITAYLTGFFLVCREALRTMRDQGAGRIVLMSSLAARVGAPGAAAFAASSGGVLGLARSLAREVAADGIRVNTLSHMDVLSHPRPGADEQRSPLPRRMRAEDIVDAALFLLSDESSYLVGQDLRVTGGAALW